VYTVTNHLRWGRWTLHGGECDLYGELLNLCVCRSVLDSRICLLASRMSILYSGTCLLYKGRPML